MGKKDDIVKKVGDDLKEVGEDLKEFAREEKSKILNHDPHDDVKKKLSHDDKAEDFVASTGLSTEGASHAITWRFLAGSGCWWFRLLFIY